MSPMVFGVDPDPVGAKDSPETLATTFEDEGTEGLEQSLELFQPSCSQSEGTSPGVELDAA